MKGAAKCDKHCELQNSVNQQVLERILRFRDIPESMPASVSTSFHAPCHGVRKVCVFVCQGVAIGRLASRAMLLTHAVHLSLIHI